MALDLSFSYFL